MNQFLKIALWAIGLAAGGFILVVVIGLWSASRMGYEFPDGDLPKHLVGRWDWSTRGQPCADSAQVMTFSGDRKVMTISMPARSSADTGWTAIYDVLSLTESRLRGAIRGESRLTERGAPVVWDLVMFGPDEYHWHRTDWKPWAYTAAMLRCNDR